MVNDKWVMDIWPKTILLYKAHLYDFLTGSLTVTAPPSKATSRVR